MSFLKSFFCYLIFRQLSIAYSQLVPIIHCVRFYLPSALNKCRNYFSSQRITATLFSAARSMPDLPVLTGCGHTTESIFPHSSPQQKPLERRTAIYQCVHVQLCYYLFLDCSRLHKKRRGPTWLRRGGPVTALTPILRRIGERAPTESMADPPPGRQFPPLAPRGETHYTNASIQYDL